MEWTYIFTRRIEEGIQVRYTLSLPLPLIFKQGISPLEYRTTRLHRTQRSKSIVITTRMPLGLDPIETTSSFEKSAAHLSLSRQEGWNEFSFEQATRSLLTDNLGSESSDLRESGCYYYFSLVLLLVNHGIQIIDVWLVRITSYHCVVMAVTSSKKDKDCGEKQVLRNTRQCKGAWW